MSGSKHKSSGDVAGTAKKHQAITTETKMKIIERMERGEKMVDITHSYNTELLAMQQEEFTIEDLMEFEVQRKDEERQKEEVTEEPKKFTMLEMAKGFYLRRYCWFLRHRTRTKNGTRRLQQTFRMQSSATVSSVVRKKELLPRHPWTLFFSKRVDRIEASKESEPVPSISGVNEIAACPLSPIVNDPSALPSPNSPPSSN